MTSIFFKDRLINIPKNYSHQIENIDKDEFYKKFSKVVLSCYFTGKKDPIHHAELENEKQKENNYLYMKPLYESCLNLKLHLIIFHDNLSKRFIDQYTTDRIIFRKVDLVSKLSINDERYIIYYEYLTSNPYDAIFSSDISDVYLKGDPFTLRKTFHKRNGIDQSVVESLLESEKIKVDVSKSKYKLIFDDGNKMSTPEAIRYLKGLRPLDIQNYSLPNLLFIGTNSIDGGPEVKTYEWFERRKDKIDAFNEALRNYIPKYREFTAGDFQIYNPGTIMGNYNTYMCFIKRFLKILFVCCKIRENNNWNMVIANYVCHHFLKEGYNPDTYHSKYIYTGYPFNSIYQRRENVKKSKCYVIHK